MHIMVLITFCSILDYSCVTVHVAVSVNYCNAQLLVILVSIALVCEGSFGGRK